MTLRAFWEGEVELLRDDVETLRQAVERARLDSRPIAETAALADWTHAAGRLATAQEHLAELTALEGL